MSKALAGISDAQIATNYTFSQIKKLQEQTDAINVNAPYFQFNPVNDVTNIGRDNIVDANVTGDSAVIGQDNQLRGVNSGNTLIFGDGNAVHGPNNLIIGDANVLYSGAAPAETNTANVLITSGLNKARFPDATNNVIIISPGGLTDSGQPIPSGSIIFGRAVTPSTQPMVQFGGANLIAALNGEALPNAGVPNAYIRIRYKDANYKIPVWNDDDNQNP